MKKTVLVTFIVLLGVPPLVSQNIQIPDQCFIDALIRAGVDTNKDELISYQEAEAVEELITWGGCITDLRGIEAFVNLRSLDCAENQIRELDLSTLSKLENLNCSVNKLSSLDLSHNPLLDTLACGYNELNSLKVSSCRGLKILFAAYNQLEELDLTQNTRLKQFWCDYNRIRELDVSLCPGLEVFHCSANLISDLDVSRNPLLQSFGCSGNQLSELDLSTNTTLVYLNCHNNLLKSLDLSNNFNLQELDCSRNRLSYLDVSLNPLLGCLDCSRNPMTSLNISVNLALDTTGCYFGYADLLIHSMPTLTQVCVWTLPFPPESVRVDDTGSPNIYYTTVCTAGTTAKSLNDPRIFPNPTAHLLNIEVQQADRYNLELTSPSGKHIQIQSFTGSSFQWDLSGLPAGIYILSIRATDYSAHTKIMKY